MSVEPDYLKHAQDLIDRLRASKAPRPAVGDKPNTAPSFTVINAPRDCVFVFQNLPKPDEAPK